MQTGTLAVQDPAKRAMLLTALFVAQEQFGYLNQEAIARVADRLSMSPNEVYSTATFYSMFRFQPVGRYVIQVCEGLSCHLAGGAEWFVDYLEQRLGISCGETTPDGRFTLQTVQCLASCGSSPALRINDTLYERVTPDDLDQLLQELGGEA